MYLIFCLLRQTKKLISILQWNFLLLPRPFFSGFLGFLTSFIFISALYFIFFKHGTDSGKYLEVVLSIKITHKLPVSYQLWDGIHYVCTISPLILLLGLSAVKNWVFTSTLLPKELAYYQHVHVYWLSYISLPLSEPCSSLASVLAKNILDSYLSIYRHHYPFSI